MIFAHDVGAGLLLLQEAGGYARDLKKRDYDFRTGLILEDNLGMIAANSEGLFDAVLECHQGGWNLLKNLKRVGRWLKQPKKDI